MAGRYQLPENAVLLTFDDGYLDNWVHVFPILKKYGMKGTIFVSPDFVDPIDKVRPNLDDVMARRCHRDELSESGFLSWAEMREMEKSGLIDIQSHAMTHTWYFSGPRIQTFHEPHDVTPYPWLFWNERPTRKPYYLNEDQQHFLPWGYPVLEHQKSLLATRFFPDEQAVAGITAFVAERGGRSFFNNPDWRATLEQRISKLFKNGILPGRYETESERATRIREELQRSRTLIGENLGKTVDYICWPAGAYNTFVEEIARSVGYRAWTLSSSSQTEKRNYPGADPTTIKRIGTSNQIIVKGRRCGTGGPVFQLLNIMAHQHSTIHAFAYWVYKLAALVRTAGGARL
jgi:peptidoglycan/xylan/chitin deacetylase (PgdA/CDA1 family)